MNFKSKVNTFNDESTLTSLLLLQSRLHRLRSRRRQTTSQLNKLTKKILILPQILLSEHTLLYMPL